MEPTTIISVIIIIILAGYLLYIISGPTKPDYPSPETVVKTSPSQEKWLNDGHILSYLQYEPVFLPMVYSDGLYWVTLVLQDSYAAGNGPNKGASYRLIADTGSDIITVPSPSCTDCEGPTWMVQSGAQVKRLGFQGGQEVYYQYATAYSPTLRQNLQIGVMVSGSNNDHGPTINVFGLMNVSLQLHYITIDFRKGGILFEASPSVSLNAVTWSQFQRIPYWALPITGVQGVDWVILDTGTEFVIADQDMAVTNGFSFWVGSVQVQVPASSIRVRKALVPRSIVLGNVVMRNYNWLLDFLRMRVAIV